MLGADERRIDESTTGEHSVRVREPRARFFLRDGLPSVPRILTLRLALGAEGPVTLDEPRRPLKSRTTRWARASAGWLTRAGISPNSISVASLGFAALGAFFLYDADNEAELIATAFCVQLRLLCNLLDGMVAIEGKRQTPTGGLYNELPDRIADSLLIVALGFSVDAAWLGWFGALAAAITAYIRVLGGTFGLPQDFRGPMAKPHRMAVLTVGCLASAFEPVWSSARFALPAAAWLIAVGATLTCATRTWAIARALNARGSA